METVRIEGLPTKVLAVDDQEANLRIFEEILSEEFSYQLARSGEEALEKIVSFAPDVVLLDIMMPDMDGYQVCRRIRADERLRFTKVIMVSAKAMLEERIEGYAAGANDYLTKPFDEEELLSKLRVFRRLKSLQEVDQTRSRLLSLLANENRSPLRSIMGPAQTLCAEETMATETQAGLGSVICHAVGRLREFLEDSTRLCALSAGLEPLELRRTSIWEIIDHAVSRIDDLGLRESRALGSDRSDKLEILADAYWLTRALEIVLRVALDRAEQGDEVRVEVTREGGEVRICVIDTASEPDERDAARWFDPFESARDPGERDDAAEGEMPDLNPGLARSSILRHGGSFRLERVSGANHTVVRLPLVSSESKTTP